MLNRYHFYLCLRYYIIPCNFYYINSLLLILVVCYLLQILASNNKVSPILYIGSIRIEFYEALSNHNIGSLKLAENLFACCRTPSLGQNSRFKTGR